MTGEKNVTPPSNATTYQNVSSDNPGRAQSTAKPTDPGQTPGGQPDQDGLSKTSRGPGPRSPEIDSGGPVNTEENQRKVDEAARNKERGRP
jgi:hypothetical protein